jgi:hypothetical protein
VLKVNAAALIVRELRAESRRAANYWLRVLAAAALILVFASIMLSEQLSLSGQAESAEARVNHPSANTACRLQGPGRSAAKP